MDLLSDYQHFNAVMLRRRLNREFPAGLQEGAVNYLQKLSLHGRRENTLRSHRNVLLRFTDYLFSVGVTDYKSLSADIVNRFDAGIPHRGRGKGPRLHDLRHSFAVHILNKWSSEGKDIYTCLPILRTALGHDRITTTEKYLRLVPEAYMEVTEPFNERFHTITEVLCNEE